MLYPEGLVRSITTLEMFGFTSNCDALTLIMLPLPTSILLVSDRNTVFKKSMTSLSGSWRNIVRCMALPVVLSTTASFSLSYSRPSMLAPGEVRSTVYVEWSHPTSSPSTSVIALTGTMVLSLISLAGTSRATFLPFISISLLFIFSFTLLSPVFIVTS